MFKSLEMNTETINNKPTIKSLEIALTSNCNFHCPYCGAYKAKSYEKNLLQVSRIEEILDHCTDLKRIKLSGGEVIIQFDECLQFCRYCRERGIEIQINTNATLLDYSKIIMLKEAGLDIIHISLNFVNAKKYSDYYNVDPSLFHKLVDNIQICAENLNCVVETMLFSETMYSLCDLNHFIYDLGVRIHELQYGIQQSAWDGKIGNSALISDLLYEMFASKSKSMHIYLSCFDFAEGSKAMKRFHHFINEGEVHFTHCVDGQYQFHIHDNGDLLMCELGYPIFLGNILGDNLDTFLLEPDKLKEVHKFIDGGHDCGKKCIL